MMILLDIICRAVSIRHTGRLAILDKVELIGTALGNSISSGWAGPLFKDLDKILRITRAAIGGFILLTITSAMLIPQVLPVSGNSIVNAKLAWIRTPIEGELTFGDFKVGDSVTVGEVIGAVNNARADDNFLNQLLVEQSTLESVVFSLDQRYKQLKIRKKRLEERTLISLQNMREQMQASLRVKQAELALSYEEIAKIDSKIERYEKANRDYSPSEPYTIVSRATLEALYAKQQEVQAGIGTRINELDSLEKDLQAAGKESYAGSIVPAEHQQLVDVEQSLLTLLSEQQSLSMKTDKLSENIEERIKYLDRNRSHQLRAGVTGTLWDVGYADGSYVHNGDSVFAVADTGSLSVEGNFHQRYLDNIRVGDHATVDLMGSSQRLTGTVSAVKIRDHLNSAELSAFSVGSPQSNEFKVVIELDESQQQVPHIGQRAKVIISKSATSLVPSLLLFFK